MALSEEEYKNIWLRFKDNMENWINKRLLFWLTLLTLIASFGIHTYIGRYIDNVLEEKVSKILDSKDFSAKLIHSSLNKLDKINEEEKKLNEKFAQLEEKVVNLSSKMTDIFNVTSNFPFKINQNSIAFISNDKSLFIMEKGINQIKPSFNSEDIFFTTHFKDVPMVLITECSQESKNPLNKKNIDIEIHSVTDKKFSIFSNTKFRNVQLCWLAIGN